MQVFGFPQLLRHAGPVGAFSLARSPSSFGDLFTLFRELLDLFECSNVLTLEKQYFLLVSIPFGGNLPLKCLYMLVSEERHFVLELPVFVGDVAIVFCCVLGALVKCRFLVKLSVFSAI